MPLSTVKVTWPTVQSRVYSIERGNGLANNSSWVDAGMPVLGNTPVFEPSLQWKVELDSIEKGFSGRKEHSYDCDE